MFELLTHHQAEQKREDFHRMNDFIICSKLDEFSFIRQGLFCTKRTIKCCHNKGQVIKMAKQALVENWKYTNLGDPEKLQLSDTSHRSIRLMKN